MLPPRGPETISIFPGEHFSPSGGGTKETPPYHILHASYSNTLLAALRLFSQSGVASCSEASNGTWVASEETLQILARLEDEIGQLGF